LQTEIISGFGSFSFPVATNNNPLEVMVSGRANCSYITGLSGLEVRNVFNCTNDINTDCSFAYSLDSGSVSQIYGSIFLGKRGKAKTNYCDGSNYESPINNHLIHSAGCVYNLGDAQSTVLLSRSFSLGNELSCLLRGTTDADIILYSNIDVIGKGCDSSQCFVAFNIKGAFLKDETNTICTGSFICTNIASCNLNQNFTKNVSIGNGNFCITVENASGLMWLTRACFLEIPSISGGAGPVDYGIYWTCSSDNYWFNLYNWFSDEYETNATEYPLSSTNVIMSGSCGAYVDIDCNLWVQPNSIDTTRITDPKGICLYSNQANRFTSNVYGNASLYGNVVFGQEVGKYWINTGNINWFNINNWFLDSSFQNEASDLPAFNSNVLMYGNNAACIDLGCNLWVQPNSIDTRNSTSIEGICIYSEITRSFSGIIYGSVTLYGNARFN
jgi:hypothetical protein